MRKITTVGLLLMVFVGLAMGQVTLSLPTQTAAIGSALTLPVTVTGFNNIGSISLTITFDKSVLTYSGFANQSVFAANNVSPVDSANKYGFVKFSWFDASSPLNIGNGKLVDLLFTYKGGTTSLTFANLIASSITDANGNSSNPSKTDGQVSPLPPRLTLGTKTASPGDTVVIPLTADNLKNIGSMTLRITYDTASVNFSSLRYPANPPIQFTPLGTSLPGVVPLLWYSTTPLNFNSGELAELVFIFKKNSTAIAFGSGTLISDSSGTVDLTPGIVRTNGAISGVPVPPVGFSVPSLRAVRGKDVTIPINVTQLNNIGSLSLKFSYDASKLVYKGYANFPGTFNPAPTAQNGILTIGWFGFPYLNIGTGKLMDLVFTYVGSGSSTVSFLPPPQSSATDSAGNPLLGILFTPGIVSQDSLPRLAAIAPVSIAQADSMTATLSATDGDDAAGTLVYSAGTLPPGAAFDATTKLFGWRPGYGVTPGIFTVWFYVSDPLGGKDSTSATITVAKKNVKPSFVNKLADATVNQNQAVSFTYTATDANLDPLTFALVNPPAGASLTSPGGVFSWTPTYAQQGAFVITAVVSDGVLTDTAKATITVTKVNQQPAFVLKMRDTTIAQNTTLAFAYTASDANMDSLTFSAVNLPTGATLSAGGAFSWKPIYTQQGTYIITAVVSDGSLADTARATVAVTKVNQKPVFANKLASATVPQGQAVTFTYTAVDPNGDNLSYSLWNAPAGAAITAAGAFSWTPGFTQTGAYPIVAIVSDGSLTDTATATITVTKVGQYPFFVAKLRDTTIAQNQTLSFAYSATDPNGDALTYSLLNPPAGATITAAGAFSWTPAYPQKGPFTIVAIASKISGSLTYADTARAVVTVAKVNQAPVFVNKLVGATVAQGTTVGFTYTATDANGDSLTFTLRNAPFGAAITAAGVFSWPVAYTQVGPFVITAIVSDGVAADTARATLTVTRVNVAPVFTAKLTDTTIAQGATLTFTYKATDANADPVTFSLVNPPSGASISTAGVFTWTAAYNASGVIKISALVSDGDLASVTSANVTVTKVNVKPVKVSQYPVTLPTVSKNTVQPFWVIVNDANGDAITYTWYVNNVVVKTGSDSSYSKGWTDSHGTAEIVKVVFADPSGLKDSVTWNFTITRVARDEGVIPTEFGLSQNYPNPFNPSTVIRFDLPKEAPVTLEIYNILGVKVRTLMSGEAASAGRYTAVWDGRDESGATVTTGVYLYRIIAGDFHASKKMMLLK